MLADDVQVQDVADTSTPTVGAAETITAATAPATPAPICPCGATTKHLNADDRCARGHVLVGNATARKHGVRAFEQRGAATLPDVLRQTVEEFRAAVIADRGGASELSTLEAAYIRRLSEVEAVTRLLAGDLAFRGLTTAKGRVRSTFSRWLEALDRWDRLAQRVGTDRRARSMSLTERLAAAPPITSETTEDRDADGD